MITSGSICLIGDTGSGKTTQIGEIAEEIIRHTGKKTHLITCDNGGYSSIEPYERAGVMDVTKLGEKENPFIWLNKAVSGKFNPEVDYGFTAIDSGSGASDCLLQALSDMSAGGTNVGGKVASTFTVTEGTESLTIGGNNMSHYGIVQSFLSKRMWLSQRLSGLIMWTFAIKRGEGEEATTMLGPQIAGKASTTAIPRWFTWTFRIVAGMDGGAHTLYTTPHEENMGMLKCFGNPRMPLAATTPLPTTITPASVVEALRIVSLAQDEAAEAIKQRLAA